MINHSLFDVILKKKAGDVEGSGSPGECFLK